MKCAKKKLKEEKKMGEKGNKKKKNACKIEAFSYLDRM